jgi:hypothetical protein
MTLAHLAGLPFEEWAVPLAATGTGFVYVLRAALGRVRQSAQTRAALSHTILRRSDSGTPAS